ncbi:MAG: hypothetical protein ACQEQL_02450 [Pseudomonadota bacterium]
MKKLLMTTAIVTVMGAVPALASETTAMQNNSTDGQEVTTTTTTTNEVDRVDVRETVTTIVGSEMDSMDVLRNHDWDGDGAVDHKHTVVTINGMNFQELSEKVGDQNNDGITDYRDILAYVGDTNDDGEINRVDYINRFGADNIEYKQTYDYDPHYDGTRPFYAEATVTEESFDASELGDVDSEIETTVETRRERSDISLWERFRSNFD